MILVQEFDALNDVLSKIGFGKAHVIILLTCGFLNMYILVETMGIAVLASSALCDLQLTPFRRALIRSAVISGTALGSYFMGYLSDQFGRRKVILYSTPVSIVISFCSMFVSVWEVFGILRIFVGIFLGGIASTHMTYLGEFCMSQKCLKWIINCMAMFAGFGMIYCPALASQLLTETWDISLTTISFRPWRLLGILYILPGIVGVTILVWLPESPRFLLAADKYEETMHVFRWLCMLNRGKTLEEIGLTDIQYTSDTPKTDTKSWFVNVFCEPISLFKKPLLKKMVVSSLMYFCILCITRGLGLWFSEIRSRRDPFQGDGTICMEINKFLRNESERAYEDKCHDYFTNFTDGMILGVVFLIGYIQLGLLLKCIRPKILFCCSLLISSLFGLTLSLIPISIVIKVCFILFLGFATIVHNLLGSTIVAFAPTQLRGRAFGICDACGRIGAAMSCNLLGLFLETYCVPIFLFMPMCPFVALVLTLYIQF